MTRSVRMYDWPEPSGLTLIEGPALRQPPPSQKVLEWIAGRFLDHDIWSGREKGWALGNPLQHDATSCCCSLERFSVRQCSSIALKTINPPRLDADVSDEMDTQSCMVHDLELADDILYSCLIGIADCVFNGVPIPYVPPQRGCTVTDRYVDTVPLDEGAHCQLAFHCLFELRV